MKADINAIRIRNNKCYIWCLTFQPSYSDLKHKTIEIITFASQHVFQK